MSDIVQTGGQSHKPEGDDSIAAAWIGSGEMLWIAPVNEYLVPPLVGKLAVLYLVRDDAYGSYRKKCGVVQPTTVKELLTRWDISAHLLRPAGSGPRGCIGTYTLSPGSYGKVNTWDFDQHGDFDDAIEARNEAYAILKCDLLRELGGDPLLWRSNGVGGYHLDQFWARGVRGEVLHGFGNWLVADRTDHGFPTNEPEVFPKQRVIKPGGFGNWARLPGKHHKRDYWSEVWHPDRRVWLCGQSAINYILSVTPADPYLVIPAHLWQVTLGAAVRQSVILPVVRSGAGEQKSAIPPAVRSVASSGRTAWTGTDGAPGSDFNRRGDWKTTGLFDAGWKWSSGNYLTRPGKSSGISASIDTCTSTAGEWPLFHVFTSNGHPFEQGQSYNRFGVFAILKHGGDFGAAARALRAMGYGGDRDADHRHTDADPNAWLWAKPGSPEFRCRLVLGADCGCGRGIDCQGHRLSASQTPADGPKGGESTRPELPEPGAGTGQAANVPPAAEGGGASELVYIREEVKRGEPPIPTPPYTNSLAPRPRRSAGRCPAPPQCVQMVRLDLKKVGKAGRRRGAECQNLSDCPGCLFKAKAEWTDRLCRIVANSSRPVTVACIPANGWKSLRDHLDRLKKKLPPLPDGAKRPAPSYVVVHCAPDAPNMFVVFLGAPDSPRLTPVTPAEGAEALREAIAAIGPTEGVSGKRWRPVRTSADLKKPEKEKKADSFVRIGPFGAEDAAVRVVYHRHGARDVKKPPAEWAVFVEGDEDSLANAIEELKYGPLALRYLPRVPGTGLKWVDDIWEHMLTGALPDDLPPLEDMPTDPGEICDEIEAIIPGLGAKAWHIHEGADIREILRGAIRWARMYPRPVVDSSPQPPEPPAPELPPALPADDTDPPTEWDPFKACIVERAPIAPPAPATPDVIPPLAAEPAPTGVPPESVRAVPTPDPSPPAVAGAEPDDALINRINREFADLPPAWLERFDRDTRAACGDPDRRACALETLRGRAAGWRAIPRGRPPTRAR